MTQANGTATKTALKNISELQRITGLSRATIAQRAAAAGILPHPSSTGNKKFYLMTAALERALNAPDEQLKGEKLRGIILKNQTEETKLQKLTGEVAPVKEFADITNQLFGAMLKKMVLQMPAAITKKVRAAKSDAEGQRIMSEYAKKIFNDLKENFEKWL